MDKNLYLMSTDAPEEGLKPAPFGFNFSKEEVAQADKLQVWATTFNHSDEFTEGRLYNGDTLIAKKRIGGF